MYVKWGDEQILHDTIYLNKATGGVGVFVIACKLVLTNLSDTP